MDREIKITSLERSLAAILDMQAETAARQIMISKLIIERSVNNAQLAELLNTQHENMVKELKASIFHSLSEQYGDLPPDILEIVNTKP